MKIRTLTLALALSFQVHAESETSIDLEALEKCASFTSDSKRLSCYDEVILNVKKTSSDKQTLTETAELKPVKTKFLHANIVDSPIDIIPPEVREDETAVATTSSEVDDTKDLVNKETSQAQAVSPEPSSEEIDRLGGQKFTNKDLPDDVSMIVSKINKNAFGVRTFIMKNGQVWKETSKARLRVKKNQEVVISQGAFSSYFLSVEGRNSKVRVKRIK